MIRVFEENENKFIENTLTFEGVMNGSGLTLSSGDIYICYTGTTSNLIKAYMYVTTDQITALGLPIVPSDEDARLRVQSGGWIKAENYLTRTVRTSGNNGGTFYLVNNFSGNITSLSSQSTTSLISNLSYNLSI